MNESNTKICLVDVYIQIKTLYISRFLTYLWYFKLFEILIE